MFHHLSELGTSLGSTILLENKKTLALTFESLEHWMHMDFLALVSIEGEPVAHFESSDNFPSSAGCTDQEPLYFCCLFSSTPLQPYLDKP